MEKPTGRVRHSTSSGSQSHSSDALKRSRDGREELSCTYSFTLLYHASAAYSFLELKTRDRCLARIITRAYRSFCRYNRRWTRRHSRACIALDGKRSVRSHISHSTQSYKCYRHCTIVS